MTPEVFKDIEVEIAKSLGFDGHQRHCGSHDPNAQVLAPKFATMKWAKQVLIAENTLKRGTSHTKKIECGK